MRAYLGEPVTVAAHLLQAGALAEAAGAPPALVAAALLHDVGHLPLPGQPPGLEHEARGAAWLSAWFPAPVTEPVRLHVAAKRYLCAIEPSHVARLSPASAHAGAAGRRADRGAGPRVRGAALRRRRDRGPPLGRAGQGPRRERA